MHSSQITGNLSRDATDSKEAVKAMFYASNSKDLKKTSRLEGKVDLERQSIATCYLSVVFNAYLIYELLSNNEVGDSKN